MIMFEQRGNFNRIENFLNRMYQKGYARDWDSYGREGVAALSKATPIDSGKTANSWYYEIVEKKGTVEITWRNSNVHDGVPIAIILQYGHATGNGGYVKGVDYINPAIRPIFEEIANSAWKEVSR